MLKPCKKIYEYQILDYEVTDADTVKTLLDYGFDNFGQKSCRLWGIDTPELKTTAGKLVRQVVTLWFSKQTQLTAFSHDKDKYEGRYVGRIRGVDLPGNRPTYITDLLTEWKLCKIYFGGTKDIWTPDQLAEVERIATTLLPMMVVKPPKAA